MFKVYADAGHGLQDPGAVDPVDILAHDLLNTQEAVLNLHVVLYFEQACLRHGFQVKLSREDNTRYLSPAERAAEANAWGADRFLSFQFNAATVDTARGIEVWAYAAGSTGDKLAQAVYAGVQGLTPWADRGVKYSTTLSVLANTNMPAIILEGGFITNTDEEVLVNTDGYQFSLAEKACEALCKHLGVAYIAPTPHTNYDMMVDLRNAKKQLAITQAKYDDQLLLYGLTSAQLTTANQQITDLTAKLADANGKLAAVQADAAQVRAANVALQTQLDTANAAVADRSQRLADIQTILNR